MWRTAHALDQALTGARLTRTEFRVPQLAVADLTGALVEGTRSRGKHLLTRIGDEHTLHTHLKMEGAWHLYRAETRWQRPLDQVRVVLHTPRWLAVGFSLGVVELLPREAEGDALAHLGPDLLGDDWDLTVALTRLRSDPDRTVAEALLDQRNLAGVGNLYMSEVCFLRGVRPDTPLGQAPDLPGLVTRVRSLLEANKQRRAQTTTGDTRPRHRHWVYQREGEQCRRCGTSVARVMLGPAGRERAAYFCPSCQP